MKITDKDITMIASEKIEKKNKLIADWDALLRTFVRPENEKAKATLIKYMEQILFELQDFLKAHVGITEEISLPELCSHFTDTKISKDPEKKLTTAINDIVKNLAPYAVNIASPYFIGHMTSAIPFFMVHLKTIVTALNQNVNKLETSKVTSIVEKQVLAKIHRLIYNNSDSFYNIHVQNPYTTLGAFVEGGTSANFTALWVARNLCFAAKDGFKGVEAEGLAAAYAAYNIKRSVILVSRRGHFSLKKAAGFLGIGNQNIIAVDVDNKQQINFTKLQEQIKKYTKDKHTKILAVVGIAGTTETGTVDPLKKIAGICKENNIYFHVDAAWGGPTLMSEKYKYLLDGIELADSVTIDGHKQFYMPIGCGMVYFKDPHYMEAVAYHSNYVNRPGSVDLGIKSIAGSREANSLVLDSSLKIMGTKGYALLIDHGIETAALFANEIKNRQCFELITPPKLNILTYRICPNHYKNQLRQADPTEKWQITKKLNAINRTVQRIQREAGFSFVSRTRLIPDIESKIELVVLRSVIMNPMTDLDILKEILDEQEKIYHDKFSEIGSNIF